MVNYLKIITNKFTVFYIIISQGITIFFETGSLPQ